MKNNYEFGWILKNNGWTEIDVQTSERAKKSNFVTTKLSPCVAATREWDSVEYRLLQNGEAIREYAVVTCVNGGSRWINITGDSLAAIFAEVAENMF